jgi:WhiB family redox-sensing transcriptional regulator
MTWRDHAACKGMPTHWWYSEGPITSEATMNIKRAKKICAGCQVQADCLADGADEEWGIWGGLGVRARWELGRGTA